MCEWLDVSKSGYYEWRDRPASLSEHRREELKVKITQVFNDSYETYGYRRVHAQLVRDGEDASDELVRRLMRELGLVACQPRPYRPVTTVQGDEGASPIWSGATSPPTRRARGWSGTSPTSRRGRGGCIWPR